MIRRFNFTGRKRLPRSRIDIRLAEAAERRSFDAELNVQDLGLPERASVFVEAYDRSAYRRFDFGTVGAPRAPTDRSLDAFGARRPLFRVKVVLTQDGIARIVAAADRVVPQEADEGDASRQPLLPVEYADLGDRVWMLDLASDWPRLVLNERFDGIREAARSGPEFLTLVYPEVFRAILARAIAEDRFDPASDDDDWGTLWLRFACHELAQPSPPPTDSGGAPEWIDDAVNAFCAHSQVVRHFEALLGQHGD